jgi:hypothetical protein
MLGVFVHWAPLAGPPDDVVLLTSKGSKVGGGNETIQGLGALATSNYFILHFNYYNVCDVLACSI